MGFRETSYIDIVSSARTGGIDAATAALQREKAAVDSLNSAAINATSKPRTIVLQAQTEQARAAINGLLRDAQGRFVSPKIGLDTSGARAQVKELHGVVQAAATGGVKAVGTLQTRFKFLANQIGETITAARQLGSVGFQQPGQLLTAIGAGTIGAKQIVAAAAGAALAFAGGKSIFDAAAMEKFTIQWKVLLGSTEAARERMAELSEFAFKTPFELPEVVNASRILEVFTKGALSTGRALTMVGDAAAGTGSQFEEVGFWVGRLYDGMKNGSPIIETVMALARMGIISTDARDRYQALADGVAAGTMKFETAWKTVEKDFSRFDGMMGELSLSFLGKLSNFKDETFRLLSQIGESFLPAAKGVMDFGISVLHTLTDLVKGAQDGGRQVREAFANWGFEGVADVASGAATVFATVIGIRLAMLLPAAIRGAWLFAQAVTQPIFALAGAIAGRIFVAAFVATQVVGAMFAPLTAPVTAFFGQMGFASGGAFLARFLVAAFPPLLIAALIGGSIAGIASLLSDARNKELADIEQNATADARRSTVAQLEASRSAIRQAIAAMDAEASAGKLGGQGVVNRLNLQTQLDSLEAEILARGRGLMGDVDAQTSEIVRTWAWPKQAGVAITAGVLDGVKTFSSELWSQIDAIAKDAREKLMRPFSEIAGGVDKAFSTAFDNVDALVKDGGVAARLAKLFGFLDDPRTLVGLRSASGKIKATFEEATNAAYDEVRQLLRQTSAAFRAWEADPNEAGASDLKMLEWARKLFGPEVEQLIRAGAAKASMEARKAGMDVAIALADGIRSAPDEIKAALDQLHTDLHNAMTPKARVAALVKQLGSTWITEGLKNVDPVAQGQAKKAVRLIEAALKDLGVDVTTLGGKAGSNWASALGGTKVQNTAQAQADALTALVGSALAVTYMPEGFAAGETWGQGVIDGILSKATGIATLTKVVLGGKISWKDLPTVVDPDLPPGLPGPERPPKPRTPPDPAFAPPPVERPPLDWLAYGGRAQAGMPYVVGEHKRELFIPTENGRVAPIDSGIMTQLKAIAMGTGPRVGDVYIDARGRDDAREIRRAVEDGLAYALSDQAARFSVRLRVPRP